MMKGIIVVLIAFTISFIAADMSPPCDCVHRPLNQELINSYDLIFTGVVVADTLIDPSADPSHSFWSMKYRFSVNKFWKGQSDLQEAEIRTGIGGGDCGFMFEPDKVYLVYARMEDGSVTTSICDPTKLLAQADKDLKLLNQLKE